MMGSMRKLLLVVGLAFGVVGALSTAARAQQDGDADDSLCPEEEGADGAPKVEVIRGASGEQIVRIKQAFCIEGKIQKPNVFYVLERTSIGYQWQKLTKDFMPRILHSVERAPF